MRKFLTTGLVVASLAATTSAYAVPMIGIQIYVDGILDKSAALQAGGSVTLTDSTNPFFNSITVTSLGVPASTDPNFGTVTINASSNFASGSHILKLVATQTGLTGSGLGGLANTFTYNGLANPGNVTSSVGANYIDTANTAFAQTTLIATTPNEGGQITYSSPVITYTPTPAPLFSETEVYTFTFTGSAIAQSSAQITGVPEPLSLALLGTGLVGLGVIRSGRSKA